MLLLAGLGCAAKRSPPVAAPPAAVQPAASAGGAAAAQAARQATLVDLANDDLAAGRYVSAERRAMEALAEDPDDADAYAVLGAARWRAGDLEGSTRAYEQALVHAPGHYGATLGLARNLQTVGRHAEAAQLQAPLLAQSPEQVEPLLTQLWSAYALGQAEVAVELLDRLFARLPADDPRLPLLAFQASFLRPLVGTPLLSVVGEVGSMDAGMSPDYGVKYSSAVAGETFTRVVFAENREEALVDPALVEALGLPALGSVTPLGAEAPTSVVLVPALAFGDLELRQVPALVQPLEAYAPALDGETPGVILGRQALAALGSYTFDFAARTMTARRVPLEPEPDAIELPFLLVDMRGALAPAVPVRIDGSEHRFFVYFGGFERSSLVVDRKHYLKSGNLPRTLDEVDDEARGLEMVFLRDVSLGGRALGGAGGLVLTGSPPDPLLETVVRSTAFELGGYLNLRMMEQWAVTYVLPAGRVFLDVDPKS